jgi:hypothetical protein
MEFFLLGIILAVIWGARHIREGLDEIATEVYGQQSELENSDG